jgi:hypothetical protein
VKGTRTTQAFAWCNEADKDGEGHQDGARGYGVTRLPFVGEAPGRRERPHHPSTQPPSLHLFLFIVKVLFFIENTAHIALILSGIFYLNH